MAEQSVTTIDDVLTRIRTSSETEKEKGDKFERLMLAFFRLDPTYALQFKNVWMWSDWPGSEGKPDTGIDLVAENASGEGFTAIQCKCYASTTTLDKSDIDSFFTASGKSHFTHRIIVSTTNQWTKHALDALDDQNPQVTRIGVNDLDESSIDWGLWDLNDLETLHRKPRKTQWKHQTEAIDATLEGFKDHDRGKLIMACGTGKTYTAQRIAEELVGPGGTVLVLMPSISLLSQTLKEWTANASIPIAPHAVCSDTKAGKKRDSEDISPYDLALPATTDPDSLVAQFDRAKGPDTMSVFFSTYQSIGVFSAAQRAGIPDFELVVADEAHRTTGVTLAGEDDSAFTKVHDDAHVKAAKRLYMTATPRVFSDAAKGKARSADAWLASMDDVDTFGPEFHRLGFHQAVERNLLTDYKVLVLAVDEEAVSAAFQQQLSDDDHELKLDDATRIVGCVNALAKRNVYGEAFGPDDLPMRRAVAFSNTIAHSKKFTGLFEEIANQWNSSTGHDDPFHVQVNHVDGKFNSLQREDLLRWLKGDPGETGCHMLSNAKCLTEGVDVPDLDAILFLEPRNSMVDVIQAVGRVMRKAEGKKYGYVVLPVGIPADETPEQALNNNKRFKAVWQVLNALRSHDERMNAVINKLDLNDEPPDMIEVVAVGFGEDESGAETGDGAEKPRQLALSYPLEEIREGIFAKLVLKVGTRHYWEDWASDVAEIASKHEARIRALINDPDLELGAEFDQFVKGLHTIINDSITHDDAIAMLSQHLITKPVFDALFTGYDFSANNPVSRAMQAMIHRLDDHALDKEIENLEGFYDSVRLRVEGIDNAAGKQRIITELYEGFFSKAFPKAAESLGIVYTPIEIVDFVLHAADHALRKHFGGVSISDEGVNVLDPFCGTGTFLVRLLQSGIIKAEDLARKYSGELHSNELLLLAYYIAAVNIESTYHDLHRENGDGYQPFNGIVLTDTFQLGEIGEGSGSIDVFPINNERADRQKKLGLRVIVGNPPYSIGQTTQNDENQNLAYPRLDGSITNSYAHASNTKSKRSLYDSYVRAFRWASNRVLGSDDGGVIAFVTNGGFIDNVAFDGFRKTVASEFHQIYCYNLRGNQRTAGELSRQEGGKVFGAGSRATVAITLLVKQPGSVPEGGATIHYRDIGNYLSREDKLAIVASAAKPEALDAIEWQEILANDSGDWINQRSPEFLKFHPLFATESSDLDPIFGSRNLGLASNRDAWNYNSSPHKVVESAERMVSFYNTQVDLFHEETSSFGGTAKTRTTQAKSFVQHDSSRFSWTRSDYGRVAKGEKYEVDPSAVVEGLYRPFFKQYVNAHPRLNAVPGQLPRAFQHGRGRQLAICVSGTGPFTALMIDTLPDLNLMAGGAYAFLQLKPEESGHSDKSTLFSGPDRAHNSESNIDQAIVDKYREAFGPSISGNDVFFYIYGIMHSPQYREAFAADLTKQIPRIPLVSSTDAFWAFVEAGTRLGDLHTRYEEAEPWADLDIRHSNSWRPDAPDAYRVEKMRYAKDGTKSDLTTVIYNSGITIGDIPEETHDYRLGARSALDWIIDRYQIKTDKDSGIINDPNDWAIAHGEPTYVFDLLRRIVTVSMKTNEISAGLPNLKF